ncbi:MAG TPA: phosphoribosylglycinamide formyltransferase [Nitrososphaeraceae archaeon]|nr:phosphoribosylglycinamide formyltransferase [Nitrososphaeraceae archaeon]
MLKLAILISGRGSNLRSILQAIKTRTLIGTNAKVVISNNAQARGIAVAKQFNIATEILSPSGLRGWSYDKRLVSILEKYDVSPSNGLVCLAGYMRVLSPEFVAKYKMRIINVHPSLLPAFPGLHAQRQALEYGVKVSGCTIHFVDEKVDSGSILLQRSVRVLDSDSEETLSKRILAQEHKLYPQAIRLIAERKVTFKGRKVILI